MNTYVKYVPNVFLAKCTEAHEKGETIPVTTKYGTLPLPLIEAFFKNQNEVTRVVLKKYLERISFTQGTSSNTLSKPSEKENTLLHLLP